MATYCQCFKNAIEVCFCAFFTFTNVKEICLKIVNMGFFKNKNTFDGSFMFNGSNHSPYLSASTFDKSLIYEGRNDS